MIKLTLKENEVNALAQLFYEESGIHLPAMTDKPLVVKGLTAVFERIGIEIEEQGPELLG